MALSNGVFIANSSVLTRFKIQQSLMGGKMNKSRTLKPLIMKNQRIYLKLLLIIVLIMTPLAFDAKTVYAESCYSGNVTLKLTTDKYGEETSWDLKDESGLTLYSGNGYDDSTDYTETLVLSAGNYLFTIYDDYGDGIDGEYGNGAYELTDGDGILIVKGGAFEESESTDFCITDSSTDPEFGSTLYRIENVATGYWLRDIYYNGSDDVELTKTSNTGDRTKWKVVSAENSYYHLISEKSGRPLRPENLEDWCRLEMGPIGKNGNRTQWELLDLESGEYRLINKKSGKFIRPDSKEPGSTVSQAPTYKTGSKTKWRLIPVDGDSDDDGGDLSYIVTAVNDGLDTNDLYLMANGLEGLGYEKQKKNMDVSSSELISYMSSDVDILYHTGHGNVGRIATSNGCVYTNSTTVNVKNFIIATCLTLSDTSWKSAFGSNAKTIAGYTKTSFDYTDDTVVSNYVDELENGKTNTVAWYLANADINSVSDRWCIYTREGGSIVEYSARTGNTPRYKAGSNLIAVDNNEKLRVSTDIMESGTVYRSGFASKNIPTGTAQRSTNISGELFQQLQTVNITQSEAITAADEYLSGLGEMSADMIFDNVYSIQTKAEDTESYRNVGWCVKYIKQVDGLSVRGNRSEFYKTVIVTRDKNIAGMSKYWADAQMQYSANLKASENLLSVGDAFDNASGSIGAQIKSGVLEIVDVSPVYGIDDKNGGFLVPAYGFIASDNTVVVVNALTGELM